MIAVYPELGAKRTVAGALAWPSWYLVARAEAAALQTLIDYAPRYARVLDAAVSTFPMPHDPTALVVTERLTSGSGTDFGVPEMVPTDNHICVPRAMAQGGSS